MFKNKKIYFSIILLNLFLDFIFAIKDPFATPKFTETIITKTNKILLEGVIKTNNSSNQYGAILSKGDEKKIVFLNDTAWNYKVVAINLNYVLLNNGLKNLKLPVN